MTYDIALRHRATSKRPTKMRLHQTEEETNGLKVSAIMFSHPTVYI